MISDTRFGIVMVRRSLEAAKAIMAGNSSSLMASVIGPFPIHARFRHAAPTDITRHDIAERLARGRQQ
jgi:hypothetical protein